MEHEAAYRSIAVVLMSLGLLVRIFYQRKLRAVRKDAPRGPLRDRIHYFVVMASFLLVFVYAGASVLDGAHVDLADGWRLVGAALAVSSLGLFVACHQALGRNWSGVVQLAEEHALVTHGPYRYVRHPMYTSFFCTALGFSLLTANWLVAIALVGSVTLMYTARVDDEEGMMLEAFGDAYRAYMARTGRLLPRFERG